MTNLETSCLDPFLVSAQRVSRISRINIPTSLFQSTISLEPSRDDA